MIVYTVKKGDTLWKLSHRYQVDLDTLISANPDISDPNYILVGQQINIPQAMPNPLPSDDEFGEYSPAFVECSDDPWARPCIYVAHEGETLAEIGNEFMIPLSRLLYYNLRYGKLEPLAAGSRIIIPDMGISPVYPSSATENTAAHNANTPIGSSTIRRPPTRGNIKKGPRNR